MPNPTSPKRVERNARLRWVPIADMHVSPLAQREVRPARAAQIAATLDLEQLGAPTVNERDGKFYIIDGQHRVEALRIVGWGDQQIQCWTYLGLTEEEEAEKFLKLNDTLTVDAFSKFRVGVQAGRVAECDVDRIVRACGLRVSRDKTTPGSVSAVGALLATYRGPGPKALARTLRIIRDAYGDAGLTSMVINGVGLLCARYEDRLDETEAIKRLGAAHGGVNGLINRAITLNKQLGKAQKHCVAAAAVDIYNAGRPATSKTRLPAYWRDESAPLLRAVEAS